MRIRCWFGCSRGSICHGAVDDDGDDDDDDDDVDDNDDDDDDELNSDDVYLNAITY